MQLDVLIFDMDGVLIDVSDSYRTATRETVQFYFEQLLGLAPINGELVSREDVAALKFAGGFNNDWDLTTALVKYFLALIDEQPASVIARSEATKQSHNVVEKLHLAGQNISVTVADLARRKDVANFARRVAAEGGGLDAVRKILGDTNDHLLFASGDFRATNLIRRIFEELYLDETLFQAEYGEPRRFIKSDGLIHREKLIPRRETLDVLSRRVSLGIATGRPRNQAQFALAAAGISNLFRSVVTLEDVLAAEEEISFSKPHPFSLLQAARNIAGEHARCAYVGDTLDDIRAANTAKREMNFVSIGCLAIAEDKAETRRVFERAGADVIIEHPNELVAIIETGAGV